MSPRLRLAVALVSTALVFYIAMGTLPLGQVLGDTTYGQLALFNEVIRIVLDNYVENVNLDRAMEGAELGLTEALDGDSAYLDARALRELRESPKDVGDVGLVIARRYSFLIAVAVRPGSPAEKAGLRPGDVIKSMDGRHARTLTYPLAERLLQGIPGSVLKLKLLKAQNEVTDVQLVRERFTPVAPHGRMLEGDIGYLKITQFTSGTASDVERALEGLKRSGARQLVLDLRGGAHGVPTDAVQVAGLFVKEGVVTRLVSRHGSEHALRAGKAVPAWDLPVVVLVDSTTAGPGEVLAAALIDAGCQSVGQRTFGRAAVQKTIPVGEGAVVLTVGKYVSPKGTEIHGKGLEPKVAVQVTADLDEDEQGANAPDEILGKALEILRGSALKKAA